MDQGMGDADICCSECEEIGVIEKNHKFECQNCHETFDEIFECEFCGHHYAAAREKEGTYLKGCCQCEGRDTSKE
ncbi:TPA: hypothetical protein ACGYSL_001667 [Legionella pneumophila]